MAPGEIVRPDLRGLDAVEEKVFGCKVSNSWYHGCKVRPLLREFYAMRCQPVSHRTSRCPQSSPAFALAALAILVTADASLFAQAESPGTAQATGKHTVPPQAEQQKRLDVLDEIYELQKKRTDEEMGKLIEELLASADESRGKPTDRFVLLRKAMELASEVGDAVLTMEVVDRIAADFQIDLMVTKGKMLRTIASNTETKERIASLVEASNAYIDDAIAQKRFDYALSVATLVYRATQSVQGKDFRTDALKQQREVQKLHADYQKLAEAVRAVQANPTDAEANLTAGQLYCFSYGDWERGLRFLAQGSDATLAALADADLATPVEWAKQAKIGDGWWDLAAKKKDAEKDILLRRAVFWYEKAQSAGVAGLAKVKVEKRLEEFANMEQAAAEEEAGKPSGTGRGTKSALPNGAVAIYTFDKATIGRKGEINFTRDLSGKWRPAALIGGGLVQGIAGEGFAVTGRGNYVDLGIPNAPTPKTVSFWAKSAAAAPRDKMLFGYWSMKGSRFYIGFNARGALTVGLANSGWGSDRNDIKLDTNWHHYVVTYDGSKMTLYLDGKPCMTKTASYQPRGRYFLGTAQRDEDPEKRVFTGTVDEFVMFDRVLAPNELGKLYEIGKNGKSLKR